MSDSEQADVTLIGAVAAVGQCTRLRPICAGYLSQFQSWMEVILCILE